MIEPIQVKEQTDVRARIAGAFERRLRGLSPMMKQLTLAAMLGVCFGSPADAQTAEANYWLSRILHTRTHFARPYPLPPRRHRIVTQAAAYRPPPSPTIYCGAPCASIPILLGVGF